MLSEELRRRISELNRKNIKVWPLGKPPQEEAKKREAGWLSSETLSALLGGEEIKLDRGSFLRIKHRFREFRENAEEFLDRYNFVFQKGGYCTTSLDDMHKEMFRFLQTPYEKIIYLDIESCGLASSPIFLIGVMYPAGNDFVIDQFFARDYTEEPFVLAHLLSIFERFEVLVTFNGKTFDYPYIRERGLLNRIYFDPEMAHFDLLHESRRRWKEYLPDCKLQTIERYILKRRRSGDLSGDEIPEIYHEFVRTGEISRIKIILQHNLLDLVSMSEIVLYMMTGHDESSL